VPPMEFRVNSPAPQPSATTVHDNHQEVNQKCSDQQYLGGLLAGHLLAGRAVACPGTGGGQREGITRERLLLVQPLR
jgi:hypothetical protein